VEAFARPIVIFINTGIKQGQISLVFSANYLAYWLVFVVLSAVFYIMGSRMTFRHLVDQGARMGFAAAAAIVTGLFFVAIAFYATFAFSKVAAAAWHAELVFCLVWLLVFLFMAVSAPSPR
jgi:O-antigen/teichoic acid export membrane protein